jgi:hypothetical protein
MLWLPAACGLALVASSSAHLQQQQQHADTVCQVCSCLPGAKQRQLRKQRLLL